MNLENQETFSYVSEEAISGVTLDAGDHQILDKVNQKVAAAACVTEIVDFLFESTLALCPCDRIGLAFVSDDGRVSSYYVRSSYEPLRLGKGYSEALAGSSLQTVITKGQPRIINDLEKYLQGNPQSRSTRLLVSEGVRSSMTCPLAVNGRNVGLLFRSSRKVNSYDIRQVRIHQIIAERLSQAVEKAYRIEQLTEANRAYTEMLGFVSHELKSPVASIVMTATALAEGFVGPLTEAQKDRINAISRKGNYLLGIVREYLDLARIESGELTINRRLVADFNEEIVKEALGLVEASVDEKAMQVITDAPDTALEVYCDPDLMKIVMVNLLGNAAKYGRPQGRIDVKLACEDDRIIVSVRNEGPGFAENQKQNLFRRFSRLKDPELQKVRGTGVGLYTVWRIVTLHGGRIWADSEKGQWAEFTFTLPLKAPESI